MAELVTGSNKHGSSVKSGSKRILFDVLVCWNNSLFPSPPSLDDSRRSGLENWKIFDRDFLFFFFLKEVEFLEQTFFWLKLKVVRHEIDEIKRGDFS